MGYGVQASDHEIGRVADFLVSTSDWTIRLLVLETGNWLLNRKVVVLPNLIRALEWDTQKIHVDLTEDQIRNSPEFDPAIPINPKQEVDLLRLLRTTCLQIVASRKIQASLNHV
jgi:hypothetical protein